MVNTPHLEKGKNCTRYESREAHSPSVHKPTCTCLPHDLASFDPAKLSTLPCHCQCNLFFCEIWSLHVCRAYHGIPTASYHHGNLSPESCQRYPPIAQL